MTVRVIDPRFRYPRPNGSYASRARCHPCPVCGAPVGADCVRLDWVTGRREAAAPGRRFHSVPFHTARWRQAFPHLYPA